MIAMIKGSIEPILIDARSGERMQIEHGGAQISVRSEGEGSVGPPVVLIPSLGRAAADFDDLSSRLARAG